MKKQIFYNKNGYPEIYSDDKKHLYDYNGNPLAYIHEKSIFNFDGKQLGFLIDGWIVDKKGKKVMFSKNAINRPPNKDIGRISEPKKLIPTKKPRKPIEKSPEFKEEYSKYTIEEYFHQ